MSWRNREEDNAEGKAKRMGKWGSQEERKKRKRMDKKYVWHHPMKSLLSHFKFETSCQIPCNTIFSKSTSPSHTTRPCNLYYIVVSVFHFLGDVLPSYQSFNIFIGFKLTIKKHCFCYSTFSNFIIAFVVVNKLSHIPQLCQFECMWCALAWVKLYFHLSLNKDLTLNKTKRNFLYISFSICIINGRW